ncbi:MAG: Rne/Rng family ribonuclease [Planctomycetota bacterium]|jgi:ribonuclease E
MLINAADAEEARIAVVEDGVLQELHVEISSREAYLGNIYKGKVVNIEPSIGAAFVNFGGTTNGFLHASDVLPAYGRPDFDLKDIIEGRARVTGDEGPESIRAALDDDEENGSAKTPAASPQASADADDEADGGDAENGDDFGAEVTSEAAGSNAAAAAAPEAVATEKVKKPRRGRVRRERQRIPIDQLLKKGQEVVVQITKEGIGAKGPALTTFISLPGRSLVMMPSLPKCGVSRRIDNPKERRRLKKIVRELDETGNGGVGFIVRTAGTEKTKTDLKRDRDYLKKIWDMVSQRMPQTRAPSLLYQESDLVLKAMRDLFSPEIEEVVCDSKDVFMRIKDFAEKLMPHMAERIKLHEPITPLFHSFGIEKDVESLFRPRVELPSGGSIVIDQTEALVAIDVNSGRFKPGSNLEETAYKTNLDAIPEIVRQLRLRDLGGLIIIDFIDMTEERHRRAVERKMIEAMKGNKARIKVGKISPFGMLEITRQRVGPGLKHAVFSGCSHCTGTGLVRTIPSKGLSVLREVRAVLHLKGFTILQVFVAPQVHDFLANRKRRQVLDLEESVGKTVFLRSEPSYPVDVVHYRFMTADGQEAKVAIPAGLGVKA